VRLLLRIIFLAAIPVGIAAFYSVYAEVPGLEGQAQHVVCGNNDKARCKVRLAKLARTPLTRSFVFSGPDGKTQVDCRRAMGLVGDFSCSRAPAVTY
jgi:hypothetical protein